MAVSIAILFDRNQAGMKSGVAGVIAIAIKGVRQRDYSRYMGHPRKQILIFTGTTTFAISADCVEQVFPKSCRAVREGNVRRTSYNSPSVSRTNFTAGGVDACAQSSDDANVWLLLKQLDLALQAFR